MGPTRLYYGSDWNIESFYGNSKSIGLNSYDEQTVK